MYRGNVKYRKCLKCGKIFEQQQGTLALKNPLYGKCPYCGGKSKEDETANEIRKKKIEERFNELYSKATL